MDYKNRGKIMNAVEINNLSFRYDNSRDEILKDINFFIKEGETVEIRGKSGSGKSTLVNAICGLIPSLYSGHLTGEIFIFGKNIKEMALSEMVSNVGVIFQNPSTQLFSPTIEDELAFGPENVCISREEIGRRIDNILKIIGMEQYRYENPNNLSGGQQQLIAIASVLILEPKIIICDEIMSWIDDEKKAIIINLLKDLKNKGKTLIIADHDSENIEIIDRTVYIGE
ncbi:ABC transporter ATP-binding protein [Sedimentibacter sp.]|uniref:energy-coupling factor ABC transporter ATP-binding protein n=1 Tax=Sedimentibacter sp. TaxID=1960295 RepID=UPI00289D579B|nr:ABC transporter ATP-binding protein [Sedimentibacter sp.]